MEEEELVKETKKKQHPWKWGKEYGVQETKLYYEVGNVQVF